LKVLQFLFDKISPIKNSYALGYDSLRFFNYLKLKKMNYKSLLFGLTLFIAITSLAFTTIITKDIKVKESTIKWNAYKVTGQHFGFIQLKDGTLSFDNDQLVGGTFVVDMTSLTVEDLKGMKKRILTKHLKSNDFFGVKNHPTSNLIFTEVKKNKKSYTITADLTIKEITKPVSFEMKLQKNKATTKLKINRTHYNIKYRSANFFDNLKNKAIDDDFVLEITLIF